MTSLLAKIYTRILKRGRVWKYLLLSTNKGIGAKPTLYQPLLMEGIGQVEFGKNVRFGVTTSPLYYTTYAYINVRAVQSKVMFEGDNWVNNNFSIICEGEGVYIGKQTIVGENVRIFDSDFHNVDPTRRMKPVDVTQKVVIGRNVWIGNNVTILKGVHIGDNTVIANGAIVTKTIPENVVAGGIPCKILKKLDE